MHSSPALPRARRLAAAPVVFLLSLFLALAGCSAGAAAPAGGAGGSAGSAAAWSFTDDIGNTVNLDKRPTRIAGFTDQVLSLMSYGVTPVAVFGRTDVASDTRFAGHDMDGILVAGNSYGEIDLEGLAQAEPDLIVTAIYPADREGTIDTTSPYYGFKDLEQQQKLAAIAPIVVIKVGGAGLDVIRSNARLAVALGADQATLDADQKAFEASAANLTKVADETGLTVSAMYADANGIYLVKPEDEPETQLYKSLGVTYTELNPGGDYYWDIYSWENAGRVKVADVILLSVEGFQKDDLRKQQTFADDPALQAGQLFERRVSPMDYSSQATSMDTLAGQLASSKKVASS